MQYLDDLINFLPELFQISKIFDISFWDFILGAIFGFCCALPSLYFADEGKKASDDEKTLIVLGCTIAGCIGGLCLGLPSGIIALIYVFNRKNI